MSKVVLVTFANKDLSKTLLRIKSQLMQCELIDEFHFFTEKDLPTIFFRRCRPYLYRRGFGYWAWKYILAKETLDAMSIGDILIYADAGCDYNGEAGSRLADYISICKWYKSGIVAFEDEHYENKYTKGDIFNDLILKGDRELIANTKQIWAGFWLLRKCEASINFVNTLYDISLNQFDLLTDKRSLSPNYSCFIENRHDQSVFSVLAKQTGAYLFSYEEIIRKNWSNIPFIPTRHKEKAIATCIKRVALLPYRWLLREYLVRSRGFIFSSKRIW